MCVCVRGCELYLYSGMRPPLHTPSDSHVASGQCTVWQAKPACCSSVYYVRMYVRTCSGVPGWLVTLYALRKTAGMSAGSACMAWITVSTTWRMARFGTRRPAMSVISSTKLSSLQRWWPDTIAVPPSSGGRGRGYASSSSSSYSTCGRYTLMKQIQSKCYTGNMCAVLSTDAC